MLNFKFIKNPPTVEDLKSLYESEMYHNLLKEFSKRSKEPLDTRQQNATELYHLLTDTKRQYLILNLPFEEVLTEFEKYKNEFLNYLLAFYEFFTEESDNEHPDGEFPEGEEPGEDDKSEIIETFGISKTFFLNKFCEFYLLKVDDKEQLLHYLKAIRIPYAKKYAGQITKLYKQMNH